MFFNESLLLHLISKSYLLLSFHNPTLQLHPHSLIIDKFCRTSALMTSNLNLPIVLGHAVKHGVESGVFFGVEFGVIFGVESAQEYFGSQVILRHRLSLML